MITLSVNEVMNNLESFMGQIIKLSGVVAIPWHKFDVSPWYLFPEGTTTPTDKTLLCVKPHARDSAISAGLINIAKPTSDPEHPLNHYRLFDFAIVTGNLSGINKDGVGELDIASMEVRRPRYICYLDNNGVSLDNVLDRRKQSGEVKTVTEILAAPDPYYDAFITIRARLLGNYLLNLLFLHPDTRLQSFKIADPHTHYTSITLEPDRFIPLLNEAIGAGIGTEFMWNHPVLLTGRLRKITDNAFSLRMEEVNQLFIQCGRMTMEMLL
jgi:hypothetical protein